jgi:uncharacterized protein (TIGR01777 family)
MKILITGASGYVGSAIGQALEKENHELISLSREKTTKMKFKTEVITPKDLSSLKGVEGVVHLAGASIAGQRWTKEYKKTLYSSRVDFTKNIIANLDTSSLKSWVQASATGYYKTGQEILTEDGDKGESFLADLVKDWEEASSHLECRKVYLRIAMVIGKDSPALEKMQPLFENRIGAVLGSGEQYMSWVYIDDVVKTFISALGDSSFKGVYNTVAPNPLKNKDFTKAFAKAVDKKVILPPAPKFALKLLYGEMSQVLLDSHRAVPKRLEEKGFGFSQARIDKALEASLR